MKNIAKSAAAIVKVFDVIMGSGFTTPTRKVAEDNLYITQF